MIYQLTSGKEIVARIDNNFSIDYSDWVPRSPLWIADCLDQLQLINAYEDKYIDLDVVDYIIQLPDNAPTDIRRILGVEYNGALIRRLNTINPIKQPKEVSQYNSVETYSIKNGFSVMSFKTGTIRLYYQTPSLDYDVELQVYFPKVPVNSVIQGAIEWYIMYCILRRGHKHPTYSLDSKNPITNPYTMWLQESKKARNQGSAMDSEDRMNMSKMLRTFLVDLNLPLNESFRQEGLGTYKNGITGQVGII